MGGCLPLLIQMPVFIVLYRVLHKLTVICTTGAHASGACPVVGNFNPSYLSHSTDLWKALTQTNQMLAFGMDLSHSAAKEMSESFVGAIPYLILILFVTASSYVQQLQISARNKNGTPINPQQAMLLKVMPAFFALISLTLPAGVVVYFLVSNLYRIGQQAYITKAFYREDAKHAMEAKASQGPTAAAKPKPEPKGAKAIEASATETDAGADGTKPTSRPTPNSKGGQPAATGKADGNGATPAARPKPKSSGATARPAPRPVSGATPPSKNKKKR
jgi:YidC/Oxa1 family membrane protein insertase